MSLITRLNLYKKSGVGTLTAASARYLLLRFSFSLTGFLFYICGMITQYARVRKSINLRGHVFPSGILIRVWNTGSTTQIQPVPLQSPLHHALWYAMPDRYLRNLVMLNDIECSLIDFGLL